MNFFFHAKTFFLLISQVEVLDSFCVFLQQTLQGRGNEEISGNGVRYTCVCNLNGQRLGLD